MAIQNGYATAPQVRLRLLPDGSPHDQDVAYDSVIEAASRWIDSITGRRFHTTTADETRYYTTQWADVVELGDDLLSLTSIATDRKGDLTYADTWATSDYLLEPRNAPLDGKPYTRIRRKPLGRYSFAGYGGFSAEVVGKFGYCELVNVPHAIQEACILATERFYLRTKNTPLRVMNAPEMGQIVVPASDPDIYALLSPYIRTEKRVGVF